MTGSRFILLWSAAVIAAAAAFLLHLGLRFETIRMGYEVGHAREQHRFLVEQRRLLAIESATLKQALRVETVAASALEMKRASASEIVPIHPPSNPKASGRLQ